MSALQTPTDVSTELPLVEQPPEQRVRYTPTVCIPRALLTLAGKTAGEPVAYLDEATQHEVLFNVPNPGTGRPGPVFTTDHLRCLCLLLALPATNLGGATISSRAEFAALFRGGVPDTRTKQHVTLLLAELHEIWCSSSYPKENGETEIVTFKIIEAFNVRDRRKGRLILWRKWEALRVNPHFREQIAKMAMRGQGTSLLFLPAFLKLGSDIAARLYLYAAGPAYHHKSASDPFRIRTELLWQRAGLDCPRPRYGISDIRKNRPAKTARKKSALPKSRHACYRRQILEQNGSNAVLAMLEGALMGRGDTCLRVDLRPTADGDDFNLSLWSEPRSGDRPGETSPAEPIKKFKAAWIGSGRTEAAYTAALRPTKNLDSYDLELLAAASIDVAKCKQALRIAKSLLTASKWRTLLAEAKSDTLENHSKPASQQTRNPAALLMYRLIQAVAAKA